MRVALGSDHAGFNLKQEVAALLREEGHEVQDFGCNSTESVDYPDYAKPVTKAVVERRCDFGILVCSTGIGMSMVANKVPGIRAALCHDVFSARRARAHTNANILCLGEAVVGKGVAREVVLTFLESSFEGGRHARRLAKFEDLSCSDPGSEPTKGAV